MNGSSEGRAQTKTSVEPETRMTSYCMQMLSPGSQWVGRRHNRAGAKTLRKSGVLYHLSGLSWQDCSIVNHLVCEVRDAVVVAVSSVHETYIRGLCLVLEKSRVKLYHHRSIFIIYSYI